MILPVGAASFREALQIGAEVYHHLKKVIQERFRRLLRWLLGPSAATKISKKHHVVLMISCSHHCCIGWLFCSY